MWPNASFPGLGRRSGLTGRGPGPGTQWPGSRPGRAVPASGTCPGPEARGLVLLASWPAELVYFPGRESTPTPRWGRVSDLTPLALWPPMNDSEQLVAGYLAHEGHTTVVHHPDGQHNPPDFLVDGRIPVEVRRLNQQEEKTGVPRGLEEVTVPLNQSVRKVLASQSLQSSVPGRRSSAATKGARGSRRAWELTRFTRRRRDRSNEGPRLPMR